MPAAGDLRIVDVRSRSRKKAFLRLPFALYADDPDWVPPLNRDIRSFLDQKSHPFFHQGRGEAAAFLALRNGEPVGRIAAIRNLAHNEVHGDRVGFFGFFECIEERETAGALLERAGEWLIERGLDTIRGPLSPSTNYVSGLLVEGDPGRPAFMMPYNPPYHADLIQAAGFEKAMDLLAFDLQEDILQTDRWKRLAGLISRRCGATLRPLDMKHFAREVRLMVDIYHDAWSANWGFVPLNDAEIRHMAAEMRPVIRPELSVFVMIENREVGFYVALPDYNVVLAKLKGRLLPFGIFRLLAAKKRIDRIRLLLMGIRREHQHLGLDGLLYEHCFRVGTGMGIPSCEASWILETNAPMVNAMTKAGARVYRRYRIFEKRLPVA